MKVLANDGLDEEGIKILDDSGIEVDLVARRNEELIKDAGDFDGIIVRGATKVTKEVIDRGYNGGLKIIGRAGVGYDNIDFRYAAEKGIVVKNAPHGNSSSTAGLALGLMFSLTRNIAYGNSGLNRGDWVKSSCRGRDLSSLVLGIIGCGRIGTALANKAKANFKEIIGYDIHPNPETGISYVSKETLLEKADIISLNTSGKECVIGEEDIEKMKQGVYIINCARATSIDADALYKGITSKKIAGAGIDVHAKEPKETIAGEVPVYDSKFRFLPNVVLTPHIGAETLEAQVATSIEISQVIKDYLVYGDSKNAVNIQHDIDSGKRINRIYPRLFIVNKNVPGVFAKIDKFLGEHNINIRETRSSAMIDGFFASTVYILDNPATKDVVSYLEKIPEISRVRMS
jgi:D-3-phosphoglycerate dehydrogenase